MNDYEMMNQRVDQLRAALAASDARIKDEVRYRKHIMDELLDTRRQITRADIKAKEPVEAHLFPVDWLNV